VGSLVASSLLSEYCKAGLLKLIQNKHIVIQYYMTNCKKRSLLQKLKL
jgi:hypothetical protein